MAEWTNEDVRRKASRYRVDRSLWPVMAEHFDRWLAAHDAEVRVQALKDAADAYPAIMRRLPYPRDMVSRGSVKAWLRARAERGEA